MAQSTSKHTDHSPPSNRARSGRESKRLTVVILEQHLKDTREELEHVKQAQAGLVTKIEKLEERLVEAAKHTAPADTVHPSMLVLERAGAIYRRAIRPAAITLRERWSIHRHRIVWTVVAIDIVAWLMSWDTVFGFFFTLIMLGVFITSLRFAITRFRCHYRDAQQRLARR